MEATFLVNATACKIPAAPYAMTQNEMQSSICIRSVDAWSVADKKYRHINKRKSCSVINTSWLRGGVFLLSEKEDICFSSRTVHQYMLQEIN
jgi:hypothetical protein